MVAIKAIITALDVILALIRVASMYKTKSKILCASIGALVVLNAILVWY